MIVQQILSTQTAEARPLFVQKALQIPGVIDVSSIKRYRGDAAADNVLRVVVEDLFDDAVSTVILLQRQVYEIFPNAHFDIDIEDKQTYSSEAHVIETVATESKQTGTVLQ